jgi:hypothetical protein
MGIVPRLQRPAQGKATRSSVIFVIAALLSGCYYRGCACYDPDRRHGDHDRRGEHDRRYDHDRR